MTPQLIENLIVDTSAFIKNAQLQEVGKNIITIEEVVKEITSQRQLRRLVVLPYDIQIKEVFPENVLFVTEFSKKTGDYASLSTTDIKVIALTYQLERELVGTEHLKQTPTVCKTIASTSKPANTATDSISFFGQPKPSDNCSGTNEESFNSNTNEGTNEESNETNEESFNSNTSFEVENIGDDAIENEVLNAMLDNLKCTDEQDEDDILVAVKSDEDESEDSVEESDDEFGWITPKNIDEVKKNLNSDLVVEKPSKVACVTTDFAMQNVLKQIGLQVAALDGRVIKQLRTFILRCYTCFKTTSIMTKIFCPNCGNKTLKRVSVSLDENGQQKIHINLRRPLTARGKRYSLPTPKGGKHSQNPILCEDQPVPQQRVSRQARISNDPMDPDYIAGFSPFVVKDINSKSAMLGLRHNKGNVKHWMRKNPNEARRKKK